MPRKQCPDRTVAKTDREEVAEVLQFFSALFAGLSMMEEENEE